ncbi:beta-ketoacyl synthase N-terminal-like domain-containing protein [Cellulophaga omnivescoria]|uniref:beta-ketoacyl synthase N-terminal-like domain-containing protein n=1 Tax=Cellulophaga omnivescoria TaxID=1888890 RepID=UPI0022F0654D|nr:beta-ketoacyl synthase N-terminal-like domain-containing protein [Cellulophaga omnivescoria]WBU90389.1 beta-ketoacyl synthase N-terminal-like domain-containing protein [Cellulophaga omnivescoria]
MSIYITALASISPLGTSLDKVWESYKNDAHLLQEKNIGSQKSWVAALSDEAKQEIETLKNADLKYKSLDDTVLFAMYASRKALEQAGWTSKDNFGVNFGSSRGATALFEKYHKEFLEKDKASTLSSPTTTLGNISSWVAHDLQTQGPEISHSITCSTALHSLLNGVAWVKSGMANKFLVGGSEAPLTPFTIAQMRALKIYARGAEAYPCKALDLTKNQNTMVLGEGAAVIGIENGNKENALAEIIGVGYATEVLKHNISISSDAVCFQRSMKMALDGVNPDEVDVIVMHAPGTIKGDLSEIEAIHKIFCNKIPALTTNKWKIGHSFGASGMLSIELAIAMLQKQEFIKVPFVDYTEIPKSIKKVLINAVGFGGNAVSILLQKTF